MDRWTSIHPQDKKPVAPPEEKRLNIVMPCWKGDQDQAIAVLNWIGDMGMVQAPFYLLCDAECDTTALSAAARKAFSMPQYLEDRERVKSNWHEKGDHPKSAAGPNSLFRQAAWFFYLPVGKGPWLFLEPDAIPCTPDWYERLKVDYALGKKPFMGHKVTPVNHPGVPEHMSGVAIYSENTPMLAPSSVKPTETAFDISGCHEFLKQAHFSPLIYHKYRAPGFTSQEDFDERVPRHVAIWHACKDGSIYPFLRRRLGLQTSTVTPVASPVAPVMVVQRNEAPAIPTAPLKQTGPIVDIFIKTREHDYPWLEWCLKSISQFTVGFHAGYIQSDDSVEQLSFKRGQPVDGWSLYQTPKKEPGYLWQQACKLNADKFTDSDFILFMDSDCVFTRPVTPSDFIKDGKPIWLYTPLDQARPDQHVWAPVMEKFLGKKPQHEFMRRHPFIAPRWALQELRTFCQYRHGKTIEEYIMGEADPNNGLALRFSEWNCLGFFLWEYHRDSISWVLDSDASPSCVHQGFTHGGEQRKQEDLAKFKELLGGHGAQRDSATGFVLPIETPAELTERIAIDFLASQVRDNFHKARIIHQLKAAWKGVGAPPKGAGRPRKEKPAIEAPKRKPGRPPKIKEPVKGGTLLCIHSYPGANETVERHWKSYLKAGADRIVGIGTDDGGCKFPCESVTIGRNAYMSMDRSDDHLCLRLLDTVKFCMDQPEDRFIIAEYDVVFLRKFPHFEGVCAHKTGDRIHGSHSPSFHHGPWCFDRASGPALIKAMEMALPLSDRYPNNSPDIFFGLACDMAGIKVGCTWKMFTRNSLDSPGDLELAVEAAENGVHVIHGVKQDFEYTTLMSVLNKKHLALSHAQ